MQSSRFKTKRGGRGLGEDKSVQKGVIHVQRDFLQLQKTSQIDPQVQNNCQHHPRTGQVIFILAATPGPKNSTLTVSLLHTKETQDSDMSWKYWSAQHGVGTCCGNRKCKSSSLSKVPHHDTMLRHSLGIFDLDHRDKSSRSLLDELHFHWPLLSETSNMGRGRGGSASDHLCWNAKGILKLLNLYLVGPFGASVHVGQRIGCLVVKAVMRPNKLNNR